MVNMEKWVLFTTSQQQSQMQPSSAIKGLRWKVYICIIMRMFHCTFNSNNCWKSNQFFSSKTRRSWIFTSIRSNRSLKGVAGFNNKNTPHCIYYFYFCLAPGKTPWSLSCTGTSLSFDCTLPSYFHDKLREVWL